MDNGGEREMGVGGEEAERVKPYLSRAALKQSKIWRRIGSSEPRVGVQDGGFPSPCLARAVAEQAGGSQRLCLSGPVC